VSGRLGYERVGKGAPVVLLHPLGADNQIWRPIIDRLRDRRELIAVVTGNSLGGWWPSTSD
jgi:pimeloyl-ACP methyl ester carboxylesterase